MLHRCRARRRHDRSVCRLREERIGEVGDVVRKSGAGWIAGERLVSRRRMIIEPRDARGNPARRGLD